MALFSCISFLTRIVDTWEVKKTTEGRLLPILKVTTGVIHPKVLVCGDPARAVMIAAKLDTAEEISRHRGYVMFNGEKDGVELTVVSHGIGASGAAVCFEELIQGGATEIIRIGTPGSLQPDIAVGDIVLATGAIRKDGTTDQLVPPAYPAVASHRLLAKLEQASKALQIPTSSGIVLTVAALYPGVLELPNKLYSRASAIAVDMEVSALFVIASLHNVEAGAVLAIDGMAIDFDAANYDPHRELVDLAIEKESELAIRAITT